MKKILSTACLMLLLGVITQVVAQKVAEPITVRSPDGRLEITFTRNEKTGAPTYAVRRDGRIIIAASSLGLMLKQGGMLSHAMTVTDARQRTHDETYNLIVGKAKRARNHYRELIVSLQETGARRRKLQIAFRAYNDGAAFRYLIPEQAQLKEVEITDEKSEFRFPADYTAWALRLRTFHSNYEKEFDRVSVSQIKPGAMTGLPLTLQSEPVQGARGLTLAIAEANLKDYAGMYLQGIEATPNALVARLSPPNGESVEGAVCVRASTPLASPWRVVMVGDEPGKLIESALILNLNEPNAIKDSSWIKAGKTAWDWWSGQTAKGVDFKTGMNNATMRHYIDFAQEFGLEYMLIDAGWYTNKPSYGDDADTTADITRSVPEIDLPGLVAYARARNVSIILWLHWIPARDQMDRAFAYYEKLGVKGIKVDFMDRDDQAMVAFYHRILKTAAEHRLIVDLHGAYKPTGLSRTYPNYLTQEGVLGAEYNKWTKRITATHNVTLPFTRMLLGAMDYTPGGFSNVTPEAFKAQETEPMTQTSRAHALAMYVVYDSPLQMVSDYPAAYRGEAGAEFIKVVPASWDETKVLEGKIGEFITIARRQGDKWFIGAMTNEAARTSRLPLKFLGKGKYRLTMYADGEQAATNPKQVVTSTKIVTARETLSIQLAGSGGYAAYLQPVS
ncbi:MAG: glycoside hydrolase family 97 protein [Pyrinomonadaceae bacterium MAG19_C2-C3]|nr:glycoside hydrolase family 97 protein [Pyrinomonadaceae bacterium MAG19_C2-C3]